MIEVVAGVIYKDNKFLIAKRNMKKAQGGLWEFPGGKIEPGETAKEALRREIQEELNAKIEVTDYIDEVIHHYPEKDVKLKFYKATLLSEKIELLEHEDYRWITKEEKDKFEFAEADKAILEKIK